MLLGQSERWHALVAQGAKIFDISQLRFELDSTFRELDTPPSRCCWRCGCAMSCVSLITADVGQAFEACSSSAVLPAWRRISQPFESGCSSHSILVRRGLRELCKPGRSQAFGRGMANVYNSGPGLGVVQFHVRFLGNVGLHGMAHSGHSKWWGHEFCRSGCGSGRCGAWVVGAT